MKRKLDFLILVITISTFYNCLKIICFHSYAVSFLFLCFFILSLFICLIKNWRHTRAETGSGTPVPSFLLLHFVPMEGLQGSLHRTDFLGAVASVMTAAPAGSVMRPCLEATLHPWVSVCVCVCKYYLLCSICFCLAAMQQVLNSIPLSSPCEWCFSLWYCWVPGSLQYCCTRKTYLRHMPSRSEMSWASNRLIVNVLRRNIFIWAVIIRWHLDIHFLSYLNQCLFHAWKCTRTLCWHG